MNQLYFEDDLPQFACDFLNYLFTVKGKSPSTIKEYFYDLRVFLRYICLRNNKSLRSVSFDSIDCSTLSIQTISDVTLNDLYAYMMFLSSERGLSATGRARKTASVKMFFKYLFSNAKIIKSNPASELETPKIGKRLPKYLELDESKQLLTSAEISSEGQNYHFKERDYCILTLFLNCGMRLSELVGINISSIRSDSLTVIGKGNKERTVYLNDACLSSIKNYLDVRPHENVKDRDALFLSERKQRISNKTVQYLVKKYIRMSGLDDKKFSVHKLRHTAATLMYRYGHVDIRSLQQILGHENISTTEIYTHVNDESLKDAVKSNPLSSISQSHNKPLE